MDLNHFLLWMVAVSCISIIIYGRRLPIHQSGGWMTISGLILIITGIIYLLAPTISGLIGGCLWGILILVPLFGFKQVNQLIARQKYGQARRLAMLLKWIHPADGWREQPELLRALELGQRGDLVAATTILNRYKTANTWIGREATITLYQLDARWEELLEWMRLNITEAILLKDAHLLCYYLRSLGETGDFNSLLQMCDRSTKVLETNLNLWNLIRLFVFAFCGQPEPVAKLLHGPLSIYPQDVRDFWLATAEIAAGNSTRAREQLLMMRDRGDFRLRQAIARRLSQAQINPDLMLTESSRQILGRLINELEQEARYSVRLDFQQKNPIITYGIIGLNCLVFGLEIACGGAENPDSLYQLGALIPEETIHGAWWRLITATFLHFGWLHLLMNMLALYYLGPFVEFALRRPQYILLYLTTGIGSMLVVAIMTVAGYSQADFVVGASGAIMGIIGAMGAILLRGWRREKSRIASQRFQVILSIIILQVFFDLITPNVSAIGHGSGVIIGFLLASLLKHY